LNVLFLVDNYGGAQRGDSLSRLRKMFSARPADARTPLSGHHHQASNNNVVNVDD
jgi:hypothetical protein